MPSRPVSWIRLVAFVAFIPCVLRAAGSPDREFVWLEGEQTSFANVAVNLSGWGNTQFLSDGKWLSNSSSSFFVEICRTWSLVLYLTARSTAFC